MSTASSESEHENQNEEEKSKTRKSRKQRKQISPKSEDDAETLAEKLDHILSSSDAASSCDFEEEEEEILDLDENGCVDDINVLADALENQQHLSKTFNDFELREIQRKNSILMSKILTSSLRPSQYKLNPTVSKVSSSSVNRKKQQTRIDQDNLMLLKRIKSVKPFGLSNLKK